MQGNIEITNVCNFQCKHCYCIRRKSDDSFISLQKFKDIGRLLKDTNALIVYLTGGEPFIIKDFNRYYLELIENGFLTGIMTNGSLISDEQLTLLKYYPPYNIEISVYGMSDITYEMVCGKGKGEYFNKVIKSIKSLQERNISIMIKYVLMKQNLKDLDKFIEFSVQENLRYEIKPAMLPICRGGNTNEFRLDMETLNAIMLKHPGIFKIPSKNDKINCEAGDFFTISAGMKIKGCPIMHQEFSLEEILVSENKRQRLCKLLETIKNDRNNNKNFFCPEWEWLEGKENIMRYFGIDAD